MPADTDNDGFDTEDEELEHSNGHDSRQGMTLQQDDLDGRHRYWSTMGNNINGSGVTGSDQEAYFGARCRCVSHQHRIVHMLTFYFSSKD